MRRGISQAVDQTLCMVGLKPAGRAELIGQNVQDLLKRTPLHRLGRGRIGGLLGLGFGGEEGRITGLDADAAEFGAKRCLLWRSG
ncbi:MAG: hypothetical protein WCO04_10905 [Pseudomonadota bacterium]